MRFQMDAKWQADLARLIALRAEWEEHVYAGAQLHAAGVHDEARRELDMADQDLEQIGLLEYELAHLGRPVSP
jgi:hypothetical protein